MGGVSCGNGHGGGGGVAVGVAGIVIVSLLSGNTNNGPDGAKPGPAGSVIIVRGIGVRLCTHGEGQADHQHQL